MADELSDPSCSKGPSSVLEGVRLGSVSPVGGLAERDEQGGVEQAGNGFEEDEVKGVTSHEEDGEGHVDRVAQHVHVEQGVASPREVVDEDERGVEDGRHARDVYQHVGLQCSTAGQSRSEL